MLARRRAHLERERLRALAGASAAPPDADLEDVRERSADLLRPAVVIDHLRAGLDLYLDDASRDADAEIARRAGREQVPAQGFPGALDAEHDPAERSKVRRAWEAFERAIEPARAARGELRHDAARRAGGRDVAQLRERCLGLELRAVLEPAERGAIAPLDEAIARASRELAGAPSVPLPSPESVLRRLGAAVGHDPDVAGPRVLRARAPLWRATSIVPPGDRATVVLGSRGGVGGLLEALGAFGEAARGTLVSRERGGEALAGEHPAFRHGAGALFRRLAREAAFREFAGLREEPTIDEEVGLATALPPRVAWAEASAALESDPPSETVRRWRRATGSEPDPDVRAGAWDRDPRAAAAWLGEVWSILLEERLRTRWGRRWFTEKGAASWLRDVWLAEPDSTPDAMAHEAQVGTMTADAVLEACRPPRRFS